MYAEWFLIGNRLYLIISFGKPSYYYMKRFQRQFFKGSDSNMTLMCVHIKLYFHIEDNYHMIKCLFFRLPNTILQYGLFINVFSISFLVGMISLRDIL